MLKWAVRTVNTVLWVAEKETIFFRTSKRRVWWYFPPLGPLAELWKATVSFVVMSVSAHARNNSPPTGRIFMKFDIRIFFPKTCRENSSFLKVWNECRVFQMKTTVHLWFLAEFSLIVRNVSDRNCRGYQDHILCSMTIFGISFFYLRLLVITRASPSRYTTGYLQRLLQLIPCTNLRIKY